MLKVHIRRTLFAAIIAGLFGFFIAWRSLKLYEAVVEVMAGSVQLQSDITMPLQVRKVLNQGVMNDLDSDTGILRSQRIFDAGMKGAGKELNRKTFSGDEFSSSKAFQELYPMFDLDIPGSLNQYAPEQMRLVKIRVRAYSPEDAAAIANNVATAFADYRKERSQRAVKDALAMVTSQSKKAKAKLDSIDAEFRKIKIDKGIVDIQSHNVSATEKMARLIDRRAVTEAEYEGAKAELASIQDALKRVPHYMTGSEGSQLDTGIAIYRQMEAGAETELATEREKYTDEAPSVKRALEKYNDLHKKRVEAEKHPFLKRESSVRVLNSVYSELQGREATARAKVNSLHETMAPINASIQAAEVEAAAYPAVETKFFDLSRNRSIYEEQYQKNQKWVEDLQEVSSGQTSQIQYFAEPDRISEPVAPDPKKYVILSAIVGALIGLAYSFAMESFRLPVHTSWQLAELTALQLRLRSR